MDIRVNQYIEKHSNFTAVLNTIRKVILSTELVETIKWSMPTYTLQGKNVVGIGSFKSHCGIWFFQGGLLKDELKALTNAQEGKTQAMRQWRFTKDSILDEKQLLFYIQEAISNEKKGLRIKPAKYSKKPLNIADELKSLLENDKNLAEAYAMFSLAKRKEFSDYIASAKRDATKTSRLEKITPMILDHIGLNDKYRNC